MRQNAADFDEMRAAAEHGEIDALFQSAVSRARGKSSNVVSPAGEANLLDADFEDGSPSVPDQINKVEDILKKLNLIKRERNQVLKDLKDKVSGILLLYGWCWDGAARCRPGVVY